MRNLLFILALIATGCAHKAVKSDQPVIVYHGTEAAMQRLYVCAFVTTPAQLDCVTYTDFVRAQ